MASALGIAGIGWSITVVGWLLSPIIGLLLEKVLSYLGFNTSEKLRELDTRTVPKLKLMLEEVEEYRVLREARKEGSDMETLDKIATMLKTALYEAEDILDLVDYHRIEKELVGGSESHDSGWLQCWVQRLCVVAVDCIARFSRSWLGRCMQTIRGGSAPPLRWVQQRLCWLGQCVHAAIDRSGALLPISISIAPRASLAERLSCWPRSFDFNNCCTSIFSWLAKAVALASYYRNWSYEVLGIISDQNGITSEDAHVAHDMPKVELKKSLQRIEKNIDEAHQILARLNLPTINDGNQRQIIAANSRGAITTAAPPLQVIGRDEDCNEIIALLHEKEADGQPNTNNGLCYSVIGIHGIPGSGKSTLAQLVCAREKKDKEEKMEVHFDLVMWVHVSQNFNLDTIFSEMLEEATGKPCPEFKNRNTLQENLEKELSGKRFLLVLDDVWCKIGDVRELEELQHILSPLRAGEAGSKILATSRAEDALLALGATKQKCIPISDLNDEVFFELFMHYALGGETIDDPDRTIFENIGKDIAKKLKGSPLAARTVGGQLRIRPKVEFWRRVRDRDLWNETMGALWWSYQHLDEQVRRCFAFCSIFPRRHHLERDELVHLWVAEGFIKNSANAGKDMEAVGQDYFDELVSTSFLQLGGRDYLGEEYYLVHDQLHYLAETVAGSDCFRIEKGWTGKVPPDVRHLFVESSSLIEGMLTEKDLGGGNVRTLIITITNKDRRVGQKSFEGMLKRLPKLRVLAVRTVLGAHMFSFPASIGQLKHLRYLAFLMGLSGEPILPGNFAKLYHMQVLDFGSLRDVRSEDAINLGNLRYIVSLKCAAFPNIGRLTSLQTLPRFTVKKGQGYELKQLRDLNKLRGTLELHGLEHVESKEEALEANLAAKEGLTELILSCSTYIIYGNKDCGEVEAEVLEGLCPPMGLERLEIKRYLGSRYPNWMVDKQNGGPENLQELVLFYCKQLEAAPALFQVFTGLRSLSLWWCSGWNALPDNIRDLTKLEKLNIHGCSEMRRLPDLPLSLKYFELELCNGEFMESCVTTGGPNWEKIQHIPNKRIDGRNIVRRLR